MDNTTEKTIKTTRSIKTIDIGNVHFWYSNDLGHGSNNITIIRSTESSAPMSAKQTGVVSSTLTSEW